MAGKYRTYPEYKDSGDSWVGNMPSHWKLSRVKYIGKVIGGYAFKSSDFIDSGINAIKISNVSHLSFDWTDSSYLPLKFMDEQSDYIPPNGSLVFAMTRPIISGGVKVAKLQDERPFLVNQRVGFLKPSKKVNQDFLMFVTQSESFFCAFENNITTTNQPNISSEGIEDIRFICPDISEQQEIANFLDHETAKIDTLIEKQQQLITLLKEKRQAVISHAVTKGLNANAPMRDSGVEWLGEVPEHWEVRAVSKLSQKITNGYVGPTRDILVPEGVPYVQATHIKKGKVNFDKAYFVRQPWSDAHAKSILVKGDVLIVQTGAGTGDIGLVTEDEEGFNCHALIIVQPVTDVISGDFLAMAFQSQYGYSVLYSIRTGGMHPHLNCGEVQFVKIPVPPKEEQEQITEHIRRQLNKFDTLVERQMHAIELMRERRTALISAAVTGKIDVRNWQASQLSNNDREAV